VKGRVVLVTGASGGLGTYITQAFLDAGATVIGTSRRIQQADFTGPISLPFLRRSRRKPELRLWWKAFLRASANSMFWHTRLAASPVVSRSQIPTIRRFSACST